jgi:signal transduction histidine kinase
MLDSIQNMSPGSSEGIGLWIGRHGVGAFHFIWGGGVKTNLHIRRKYTDSVRLISDANGHDRRSAATWVVNSVPPHPRHDDLDILFSTAHELRTPLSALAVSSDLLASSVGTLDRQVVADLVQRIRRSTTWMKWLVDNWLSVAEVDRGCMSLSLRPVDVLEVAAEARRMVEPLLALKRQQLSIRWRGPSSSAIADSRRIQQVLLNLVTNASKFSGVDTCIAISATRRGDCVRVSVTDEGPGVSPETRSSARSRGRRRRFGATATDSASGSPLSRPSSRSMAAGLASRIGVKAEPASGSSSAPQSLRFARRLATDQYRMPSKGRCHEGASR